MRVGLQRVTLLFGSLLCLPILSVRAEETPIYAATASGVYRSSDGGASWNPAGGGLPAVSVFALAVVPGQSATVYAGTVGRGVYKTMDAGQSWHPVNTGLSDSIILTLAIDPQNSAVIYAGTAGSAFFPGQGVFKSANGGQTWAAANIGLPVAIVSALAVDPQRPEVVYAGTNFAGVYRTRNGGLSWEPANAGCVPANIGSIAVDPSRPAVLYAGLGGCSFNCAGVAGVCKSTNGGRTWTMANAGLTDLQILSLAVEYAEPRVLYAASRLSGVFGSRNSARTWTRLDASMAATPLAISHLPLLADPWQTGTVYAGTANGVYRSTDRGASWTAVNNGLPPEPRILALAMPPATCLPVEIQRAWADPPFLWPPNHRMEDVIVRYHVESACPAQCTLRVASNEPPGMQNEPDWVVIDDHRVKLRAERRPGGEGRTYSITISCTNGPGSIASEVVTVRVPNDRR